MRLDVVDVMKEEDDLGRGAGLGRQMKDKAVDDILGEGPDQHESKGEHQGHPNGRLGHRPGSDAQIQENGHHGQPDDQDRLRRHVGEHLQRVRLEHPDRSLIVGDLVFGVVVDVDGHQVVEQFHMGASKGCAYFTPPGRHPL